MMSSDQYEVASKRSNQELWVNPSKLEIPYNQRSYVWVEKEIGEYMNDIYNALKNNEFITVGTFYFLSETINISESRITIWDGQQRVITSYLVLAALKKTVMQMIEDGCDNDRCESIIGKLEDFLFKKNYQLSQDERKELERGIRTPKLYTVYENDYEVLKIIFGGKIDNLKECYHQNDKKYYVCNNCGEKQYKIEKRIIRHLLDDCDGLDHNKIIEQYKVYNKIIEQYKVYNNMGIYLPDNPIVVGFFCICEFIQSNIGTNISDIELFLKGFAEDIPHEEYICKNLESASIVFNLLNNRGRRLVQEDIIRNSLIRVVDSDKRKEYFDKFEHIMILPSEFKGSKSKSNYLKLLCDMTTEEYGEEYIVEGKKENNSNGKKCVNTNAKRDTIKEFLKLIKDDVKANFEEIQRNSELIKLLNTQMNNNIWGKLFFKDFIWDIYHYIIVPFYKCLHERKNIDSYLSKMLEIIVCFQIRSCIKMRNFINIRDDLGRLSFKLVNKNYPIKNKYSDVTKLIKRILPDEFEQRLCTLSCPSQAAYKLLVYLEIKSTPNGKKIERIDYDIDHILPRNTKCEYVNHIGNLTLLEKGNSDNGHKGNRSLQNKEYKDKIKSYRKSNIEITISIPEKYKKWDDVSINNRTKNIVEKIYKLTSDTIEKYDSENSKQCSEQEGDEGDEEKIEYLECENDTADTSTTKTPSKKSTTKKKINEKFKKKGSKKIK